MLRTRCTGRNNPTQRHPALVNSSIYWEALHNAGLLDHEAEVEHLILNLPTVSDLEQLADEEGLTDVSRGQI